MSPTEMDETGKSLPANGSSGNVAGTLDNAGARLHGANLAFDSFGSVAITFVDHKDVGDFHDAGLDGLHVIAHARNQNDDGDVGKTNDVHFILSDTDGFDHDDIATRGIENSRSVGRGAGQATERTAGGHAANEDAGIGVVVLHANAVAQNRSPGVRTGGIHGYDAGGFASFAVMARQLVHQRALAGTRRAGKAESAGVASVWKQAFQ